MLDKLPKSLASGKEYTEADKIIQFLTAPEETDVELSPKQKEKLLLLKEIHGYRLRFKTKSRIVKMLQMLHTNIDVRRAYYLIEECEYVFGSVSGVEKDYERQFLLEASRKNIAIAFKTKNSKQITSALQAHYSFCGLDKETLDLPDFSKLEQHNYIISMPEHYMGVLKSLISNGVINLNDLLPGQNMAIDIPHTEENDKSESANSEPTV